MKLIPLSLLLSSLPLCAAKYTNYISESHYMTNDPDELAVIQYHEDIANVGTDTGKKGVVNKSVYDLYVVETDSDTMQIVDTHYCDTKTIFKASPTAEITITADGSKDASNNPRYPYRVRADKPLTVSYTVKNLSSKSQLDEPRYNAVRLLNTSSDSVATSEGLIEEDTNKEAVDYEKAVDLMSETDVTKARGTLSFGVFENVEVNADEFDLKEVEVLPKHTITHEGIEDGKVYKTLPDLTFTINNMYPTAKATLYVYPDWDHDDIRKFDNADEVLLNLQDSTFSSTRTVADLHSLVDQPGTWHFGIEYETDSYGVEREPLVSPTIESTISIRGTLVTAE